jgi:hypothetical protein
VAEWSNAAALKAADRVSPVRGFESLPLRLNRRLLFAGLLLLIGGVITLLLHAAGAPETLLDFLYDTLLSGLDVPEDPSPTAVDIVNYVSLVGGIAELAAAALLLGLARAQAP